MDKRLLSLSGVFAVKKPQGESSAQTLNRLKKVLFAAASIKNPRRHMLKALKVGHGGTLDPMATGVLVVGLNGGCKELSSYLSGSKRYLAKGRFGQHYDTLDCTGTLMHEDAEWAQKLPDARARELIEAQLPQLVGPAVMQRPPAYSAVHVDGQRAYRLARDGSKPPSGQGDPAVYEADFAIPARPVAVHSIVLTHWDRPAFELDIECGGGCYVRSIIRDLAAALGTVAHMTALERVQQGHLFTIADTVAEEDWSNLDRIEQAICDTKHRRQ